MRVHYFYYHKKYPATVVLQMLDSLNQEGKKRGKLWLEIMTSNMAALYNFKDLQHYEQGFMHHQRAYDLVKNLSPAEFPHKQHCLFQMADEHYFFNDFREAIFYNLEALKAKPSFQLDPVPLQMSILNTIGLCYQKLDMKDSAEYYFTQTIRIAKNNRSEAWDGIASGNLGYNLFLEKKYAEAVPLLEKDVSIAIKTADWGLASGSLMVLANINLLRGDIAKAGEQITAARQYVSRSGQYYRLQYLYPLMAKWYALNARPAQSTIYLDSTIFVKDSLNRKFNALQMLRARQKVDLERYNADIESIQAQKTINILERNIMVTTVVLMMAGAVIVYRKQQKKTSLQKEQVLKAREELENASRQLTDFAKNISDKNALIELLEQQNGVADKDALWQLQQSTILTDADWAYFKALFEKVHAGYLQRLKEKLPGLTAAETRFMALSKLGLSTREMAAMLGIGTDAVRQHRSRLRKKLNFNEDGSLEDLAVHI